MASLSRARIEAKNKGMQYVIDKYGMSFYNRYKSSLNRAVGTAPGRSKAYKGRSILNKPPQASGHYAYDGSSLLYQEGGETPTEQDMTGTPYGSAMQLNLENDSELGQGYHHPWAQTTSVSSLITGLLRQSQQAPTDYWGTYAQRADGSVSLNQRDSSSFGYDVVYNPNVQQEQSMNPYGSFGTQQIMQEEGGDAPTTTTEGDNGVEKITQADGSKWLGDDYNMYPGEEGTYNPWAFGRGGGGGPAGSGYENQSYGPSQQTLSQATMEAMQLANNYFAPQRMELAYELGDMETDMRRLAVNLGRQVDDPTLQAKLYKEAMRAVRVMDVQQNTMALQMAEQRRREEMQNYQYYDALAAEENKIRWANRQFYDDLGLRSAYFDLQNSIGMAQPFTSNTTTTTPSATDGAAQQQQESLQGIYKSMMNYNPYGRTAGNLLR